MDYFVTEKKMKTGKLNFFCENGKKWGLTLVLSPKKVKKGNRLVYLEEWE